MRRLRRSNSEPRLDLAPLIDVIFLLLTFFVFAMVLMVRARVLGVSLPQITAGAPAQGDVAPITIAVSAEGDVALEGEPAELDGLGAAAAAALAERPGARLLIAADEDAPAGVLLRVADVVRRAGVEEIGLLGRPGESARSNTGQTMPNTAP